MLDVLSQSQQSKRASLLCSTTQKLLSFCQQPGQPLPPFQLFRLWRQKEKQKTDNHTLAISNSHSFPFRGNAQKIQERIYSMMLIQEQKSPKSAFCGVLQDSSAFPVITTHMPLMVVKNRSPPFLPLENTGKCYFSAGLNGQGSPGITEENR